MAAAKSGAGELLFGPSAHDAAVQGFRRRWRATVLFFVRSFSRWAKSWGISASRRSGKCGRRTVGLPRGPFVGFR